MSYNENEASPDSTNWNRATSERRSDIWLDVKRCVVIENAPECVVEINTTNIDPHENAQGRSAVAEGPFLRRVRRPTAVARNRRRPSLFQTTGSKMSNESDYGVLVNVLRKGVALCGYVITSLSYELIVCMNPNYGYVPWDAHTSLILASRLGHVSVARCLLKYRKTACGVENFQKFMWTSNRMNETALDVATIGKCISPVFGLKEEQRRKDSGFQVM
nr:hypothetical protein [Tanacetum cinerariifolium]